MTIRPKPAQQVDVCIIGGGPAGSVLAIRLARLGHKVCVIERSVFPRGHIGESLTPGIWPQLELIGVDRTVALAGFWPCRTALVQWDSHAALRRDFGNAAGLLVDRGRFDALLLDQARACGVWVIQPAFLRVRMRLERGWHLEVESAGNIHALDALFLADASGRSAVLRGRKRHVGPRTLALYGYWRRGDRPREPRVEAGPDCWYWGMPLPDSTYNAMVFVDAAEFRTRRTHPVSATYHDLISRSGLLSACRDARLCGPVRVTDATPYLDSDSIGPCTIKVGDAALALDPLSSSGVQKAINTALVGAVVVNTLLRRPEYAEAATRFYRCKLAGSSDRHRRWAAKYYAMACQAGPFWQTRAAGADVEPAPSASIDLRADAVSDLLVALSPNAKLVDEPCIVGDFVVIRPALCHPGLERPVAYLGGWDVAELLKPLRPGIALGALMSAWQIPNRTKPAVAGWLISHRVLMPHNTRTKPGGECHDRA